MEQSTALRLQNIFQTWCPKKVQVLVVGTPSTVFRATVMYHGEGVTEEHLKRVAERFAPDFVFNYSRVTMGDTRQSLQGGRYPIICPTCGRSNDDRNFIAECFYCGSYLLRHV